MDGEDVRVIQRGGRARLLLEPAETVGRGHRRRQDLEGNCAIQPRVVSLVDLAHAARTDLHEDLVLTETAAGGQAHAVAGLSPIRCNICAPSSR